MRQYKYHEYYKGLIYTCTRIHTGKRKTKGRGTVEACRSHLRLTKIYRNTRLSFTRSGRRALGVQGRSCRYFHGFNSLCIEATDEGPPVWIAASVFHEEMGVPLTLGFKAECGFFPLSLFKSCLCIRGRVDIVHLQIMCDVRPHSRHTK